MKANFRGSWVLGRVTIGEDGRFCTFEVEKLLGKAPKRFGDEVLALTEFPAACNDDLVISFYRRL